MEFRTAPSPQLYVFSDRTHDTIIVTRGKRITVIDSPAGLTTLRKAQEKSYLLIDQRALQKISAMRTPVAVAQTTRKTKSCLLAWEHESLAVQ